MDLQIVVKLHNAVDIRLAAAAKQRLVELSGLAGGADDQPLPVLAQETFGNPGPPLEVFDVGIGHQAIQVHPPQIILRQDDDMVGGKLLDHVRPHFA